MSTQWNAILAAERNELELEVEQQYKLRKDKYGITYICVCR